MGEIAFRMLHLRSAAPKEQPPRKLSGKKDRRGVGILESRLAGAILTASPKR